MIGRFDMATFEERKRRLKKSPLTFFELGVASAWTVALLLGIGGVCASLAAKNAPGIRDFVSYWAAGQLLVQGGNPYDTAAMLGLERGAGFPPETPVLMMRNPPPGLILVGPLGFVNPRFGLFLWSLLLLASLVVSVLFLDGLSNAGRFEALLAISFPPAIICLLAGQMSLVLLLGLALFLRMHMRRPFAAGMSLWLCLLKPHLFLPFAVVLLVWAVWTKSTRLLLGTATAISISCALVYLIDPSAWSQYRHMMHTSGIDKEVMPCLSNLLRQSVCPNTIWLQYVPAMLGCGWALAYYRRNRAHWSWLEHGSLLTLVSVFVAPYSWMSDQVILIPALLHGLHATRSRAMVAVLALASAVVELSIFGGGSKLLHSPWYLWMAPFWLCWYLIATGSLNQTETMSAS